MYFPWFRRIHTQQQAGSAAVRWAGCTNALMNTDQKVLGCYQSRVLHWRSTSLFQGYLTIPSPLKILKSHWINFDLCVTLGARNQLKAGPLPVEPYRRISKTCVQSNIPVPEPRALLFWTYGQGANKLTSGKQAGPLFGTTAAEQFINFSSFSQ